MIDIFVHTHNLYLCTLFLLFDMRIVEKEKCGKRFEICLFVTIGEIWERNEKKEKCDLLQLSNWMKLPRDWIGWMVEIGCNQIISGNSTKQNKRWFWQRQNSIFFFFQRVREMRFSQKTEQQDYPEFSEFFSSHFFGIFRMTFSRAGASKRWK